MARISSSAVPWQLPDAAFLALSTAFLDDPEAYFIFSPLCNLQLHSEESALAIILELEGRIHRLLRSAP